MPVKTLPLFLPASATVGHTPLFLSISPVKHVAFFCLIEDKLYKKLNFWVKFRAGSDEIYRKMIAE